jgi:hypothetical protein
MQVKVNERLTMSEPAVALPCEIYSVKEFIERSIPCWASLLEIEMVNL